MEGGDRGGSDPEGEGVGNLQQLRMLLALVEQRLQRLPKESSREVTPSMPVTLGGDESSCRLWFIPDRRRETLSVLSYGDRRAVNPGKHNLR
jgi:hypothetical protein